MSYSFAGANTKIRVTQFLLAEAGTYQEQNLRPFNTVIGAGVLDRLAEVTHQGKRLGIGAVQEIATEVITPAAQPEGHVNIAQGWQAKRYRFMMHVEEQHIFNASETTHRIFFGYTDQADPSYGNLLDPQMRIYFNSETVIADAIRQTVQGSVRHAIVTGSNQIVTPIDTMGASGGMYQQPHAHMIRPEDIFAHGHSQHTVEMLQSTGQFNGKIDSIIQTSAMVGQGGDYQYSNRRDTSPTRYFADTLGSWQHALKEQQVSQFEPTINLDQVFSEAQAISSNQNIHANGFLSVLKEEKGYMQKGYVTLQELIGCFPEVANPQITKNTPLGQVGVRQLNQAHQSMHWNGSEPITIAASLLAQVIPAIMMENFVRQISFAATNGSGQGNFRIDMGEQHMENTAMLVEGMDELVYLTEFQRRLVVDALTPITRNNQIPFQISVFADLVSDTVIDIAIGGEALRRYVAPTFTDSLFSPILTRSDTALKKVSEDILYLVRGVLPDGSPSRGNEPVYRPAQVQTPYHLPAGAPIIQPMTNSDSLI